jgi:hypothetical protein
MYIFIYVSRQFQDFMICKQLPVNNCQSFLYYVIFILWERCNYKKVVWGPNVWIFLKRLDLIGPTPVVPVSNLEN